MKKRGIKEMAVGEVSPIPLKPILARTRSAKRRPQRTVRAQTPQKAAPVSGCLWSLGDSRQNVWSRAARLTDDSDVEEIEELDTCLMSYGQLQNEHNGGSTEGSNSERLPSSSSLEDKYSSSDSKQSVKY
ncbi:uncharacterized protein LOC111087767 [Limulus polyphemus]|uniref:Uncharacterized protein LOC111087767 n=1 Tax=Limulus polyphemus TaxID=6850 RepID=A0ABM1T5Z9_LIMPO|nr:uncharacterized protein LOC111087767 [Limulus polyphemus]